MKRYKIPTINIKKYGGQQVAIVDGRVVAAGLTAKEVIEKARKRTSRKPLNEIAVFSVPKTLSVIYHV